MTIVTNPKITAKLVGADAPVPNSAQRVLIVSQMTTAGTATSGELNSNVTDTTAKALAGPSSQAYNSFENFRIVNGEVPIDMVLFDDPAGVAANGTIAFTAVSATEARSLTVTLGDTLNGVFELPINIGDDEDTICAALVALVQARTKCVMSAAVDGVNTNECNVTAENVGLIGNSLGIKVEGEVAGVTYAITGMSSGTLAPTLTDWELVLGDTRYQTIVWHNEYSIDEVKDFLDARFNVVGRVKDGVAIITAVDTKSNLITLGNANNSQSVTIYGELTTSLSKLKGGPRVMAPLSQSAAMASVRSLRLTDGANIADIVATNAALDTTGGAALASLPYFNTPMSTVPLTDNGVGWTAGEISELNNAGISVMGNNETNTGVLLGKTLTTYKTDAVGNPDGSFKFLNYVDTGSQSREYEVNNSLKDWVQSRLTDGDLQAFRAIANVDSITATFIKYWGVLSSTDYMLLRDGEANLQKFKDNLSVTIDLQSGKATIIHKLPIVTQFRELDITMQLAFNL